MLLIEDVSVLSVLDKEIIQAAEPKFDTDLARMITVMGMTVPSYNDLKDNQVQRITMDISFSKSTADNAWGKDSNQMDQFIGRYLNTLRATDNEVRLIYESRLNGSDVRKSLCDDCPFKTQCFETFDYVTIDDSEIGLFPFKRKSAKKMFDDLNTDQPAVEKTPRGMLMYVFQPVLEFFMNKQTGKTVANPLSTLRIRNPESFGPFQQNYASTYGPSDLQILRKLFLYWSTASEPSGFARQLEPLLPIFKLKDFSKKPEPGDEDTPEEPDEPEKPDEPDTKDIKNYAKFNDNLLAWYDSEQPLYDPQEAQGFLLNFLKISLRLDEYSLAPKVLDRFTNRGQIVIEKQSTRPVGVSFKFPEFKRDEETFELLDALARFKYLGNESWKFDGARTSEGIVARYLRKNQKKLIDSLQPPPDLPSDEPIRIAARYLINGIKLSGNKSASQDLFSLYKAVFDTKELVCFEPLTPGLGFWIEKIRNKWTDVKTFIEDETAVKQGDTGRINFVNPIYLVDEYLSKKQMDLDLKDDYINKQSRYLRLSHLGPSEKSEEIEKALENEGTELHRKTSILQNILKKYGDSSKNEDILQALLTEYKSLKETLISANFQVYLGDHDELNDLIINFHNDEENYKKVFELTKLVDKDNAKEKVWLVDTDKFKEIERILTLVDTNIQEIERKVDSQLNGNTPAGDKKDAKQKIVNSLGDMIENVDRVLDV